MIARWIQVGSAAVALGLAACAHAPGRRATPSAELVSLTTVKTTSSSLQMLASFRVLRINGVAAGEWATAEADLEVRLDEHPFAVVACQGQLRDALVEVPLSLAFTEMPADVRRELVDGRSTRLRLRGTLNLVNADRRQALEVDAEVPLHLAPAPAAGPDPAEP